MVDDPPTQQLDCSTAVVVLFDLETTGFRNTDEITQIAAKSGTKEFSKYILPVKPIPQSVTDVTGLSISDGVLCLNGVRVETTPPRVVLSDFIDFLKSCGESCVLAAHNGARFDVPFLLRFVKECGMLPDFSTVVAGFSDTTTVLKAALPQRAAAKLSFSQKSLTEDLLDPSRLEGAHNALVDCCVLEDILIKANVNSAQVLHHAKTLQCVLFKNENFRKRNALMKSLTKLEGTLKPQYRFRAHHKIMAQFLPILSFIFAGVSKLILGRLAPHGITMETLQRTYKENGERGISMLMTADVDGKPRVTKSKSIIQKVIFAVKKALIPPEVSNASTSPVLKSNIFFSVKKKISDQHQVDSF